MDGKIEFLYRSIEDTQGAIRSIDLKAGFFIAVLFSPLVAIDKLPHVLSEIYQASHFQVALVILAVAAWILAVILQFLTLWPISNPGAHVKGSNPPGTFFGYDLYPSGIGYAFFGKKRVSTRTVDQEASRLPDTELAVIQELTYEKIKLAYIRAVKAERIRHAYRLILVWIGLSLTTYLIHIFL